MAKAGSSKAGARAYWLMKSEPHVYSIDDMRAAGEGIWEGVRNYQARNFMREMQVGDLAIFYHSSAKPPGAAGIVQVSKLAFPDPTQLDNKSAYFDPKSAELVAQDKPPRWDCVAVRFIEKFNVEVPLAALKANAKLTEMRVTQKGSRLSVMPVDKVHFAEVLRMASAKTRP